jgi:hypothetical protein
MNVSFSSAVLAVNKDWNRSTYPHPYNFTGQPGPKPVNPTFLQSNQRENQKTSHSYT